MANTTNKQINKQINKFKIILHSGLIGLLGYLFIGLFLPRVAAQTMSNENYILRTQEVNTATDTQTDIEKPKSKIDLSASEDVSPAAPFSFSLSSNIVDFGILSPTNPVIRTVDLSINSSVYGYSVLVFENEPLTTSNKTFIPDTTCDFGACGTENAAEWTNALTYGFGYRCDNVIGSDCDSSFAKPNSYKQFPDIAGNDDPAPIMAGAGSNNKQTRISYKVNISVTQTQGAYSNIITYIAIPNF